MPSRNRAREAARAAQAKSEKAKSEKAKSEAAKSEKAAGTKKTAKSEKSAKSRKARSAKKVKKGGGAPNRPRTGPMFDPSADDESETRFVQPYEATKTYICPGCNRDIPPGVGHVVAVPPDDPDLRRHWHRGCWTNRHSRF